MSCRLDLNGKNCSLRKVKDDMVVLKAGIPLSSMSSDLVHSIICYLHGRQFKLDKLSESTNGEQDRKLPEKTSEREALCGHHQKPIDILHFDRPL